MARHNGALNRLEATEEMLSTPDFPVLGWTVALADPEGKFFDPYCRESADLAGFPLQEGEPTPTGFFYITDDYGNYLDMIREADIAHPANLDNKVWIDDDDRIADALVTL